MKSMTEITMKAAAASGALFVLACAAMPIRGAETPGDRMMRAYLAQETKKIEDRFLTSIKTKEDFERRRPALRRQFREMLGLERMPAKTPLKATVTGTLERETFRVEKLHFQSLPGLYVTANLYLPKKIEGRLPAIVYLCGHAGRGRDGNKTAYQHHPIWFASHGYACIILDTLQLGEVKGVHHGTYRHKRWWWQSAGYTAAGVECLNAIRAIDYLVIRPEVDPDRIGMTGRSGGGTTTQWVAALDDRVKVAVPVSGVSDLGDFVGKQTVRGHCDCTFIHNVYRWPWTTIVALIAPRPMLVLNSDRDGIFPMDGNERVRARLDRLYELYYGPKRGDRFAIGVVPGPHRDGLELRLMAYRWFNRFLKNKPDEVHEAPVERFEGNQLRVFPADADIPADAVNAAIDESFVTLADVKCPAPGQFESWKKSLLDRLGELPFRAWPDDLPNVTFTPAETGQTVTQPPVYVTWRTFDGKQPAGENRDVWILVLNQDDPQEKLPDWARPIVSDAAVLAVSPRGIGPTRWTAKNPPNAIERSLPLLGQTADSGRVWDVRIIARAYHDHLRAAGRESVSINLLGRGRAGVIAAYAALYEPAVRAVTIVDPPASHHNGPHFLHVLRVLDIPDALGLLAPRPLTLLGSVPEAFDKTRRIYEAAGAPDRFSQR